LIDWDVVSLARIMDVAAKSTCVKMDLADVISQKNTDEAIHFALEHGVATLDPHSGKLILARQYASSAYIVSNVTKSAFTFDVEYDLQEGNTRWFWKTTLEHGYVRLEWTRNFDVVHEIHVTGAEPQTTVLLSWSGGVICGGTVDGEGCCRLKCRLLAFLVEFHNLWVICKGPKLCVRMTAATIDGSTRDKYIVQHSYQDVCVCNERVHKNKYLQGQYGLHKTIVSKWLQNRELTGINKFC